MNDVKEHANLTDNEQLQWERIQSKNTLSIALSGHFSAGKSSLINHLTGVPILPTSPIPTSANQITIAHGDLEVVVVHTDGTEKSFQGTIDWAAIKRYAMDGANVEKLMIYAPIPFLQHAGSLIDTPGVDSTDPTHQHVTLEALFTTDILLYVMDYNHVKSETNLGFLKQLSDEGKPLFIVVNQVDKHRDDELSFQSYKQSILDTLAEWGIAYHDLFFTTIKESPHDELERLKAVLMSLFFYGNELVKAGKTKIEHSFYKSIQRRVEDDWAEERASFTETLQHKGYQLTDIENYEEHVEKVAQAEQGSVARHQHFLQEWDNLFRQATVFNSILTEKTANWLDAMRPNFKVGLFASKRKMAQERIHRQEEVLHELNDQINKQLVFHLRQSLQSLPLEEMTNQSIFLDAIQSLSFTATPSFLEEAVPKTTFADSFVYQYTKERTEDIKRQLKKQALDVLSIAEEQLRVYDEQKKQEAHKRRHQLEAMKPYVSHYLSARERKETVIREIMKEANRRDDKGAFSNALKEIVTKKVHFEDSPSSWKEQVKQSTEATLLPTIKTERRLTNEHIRVTDEAIASLHKTMNQFEKKAYTQDWHEQLEQEIAHIQTEQFTLSLFGAFSAGKSSLANALLGGKVLPASPHPTTATVTTVTRPTPGYANGDVFVQYKTYEQLRGELTSISQLLDVSLTLEQFQRFRTKTYQATTAAKKQALSYIETLQKSMKRFESFIEQDEVVSLADLSEKIVNEDVACLIANATIYYECEWTKRGLTLVDTPGVNSINGRHTNVAYEQVKTSDAILYVTYYNHSFSRADAQFIEQLGKMNKQFASKKLYFILNAIDLAANEQERQGVESFVMRSLEEAGIDDPALFSLSSKNVFEEQASSTDFDYFKQELYGPLLTSLKEANRTSFVANVNQYVLYLQEAEVFTALPDGEKQVQLQQFEQQLSTMLDSFKQDFGKSFHMKVEQEASELFAYLRERIPYVSRDRFIEFINVATIVGPSRKKQKEVLAAQLATWNEDSVFYLNQELKATMTRISLMLQRAFEQWKKEWQQSVQATVPGFQFPHAKQSIQLETLQGTLTTTLSIESNVGSFQSLKDFFEGSRVKQVKETLVEELVQQIRAGLRKEEEHTQQMLQEISTKLFEKQAKLLEAKVVAEITKRRQLYTATIQESIQAELSALQQWVNEKA